MKPIQLSLLFLVLLQTSYSQTYSPFPMHDAQWNEQNVSTDGLGFYALSTSHFLADTQTINSHLYTEIKFYSTGMYIPFSGGNPSGFSQAGSDGFIREDSSLKTVYIYNTTSNVESVLYNFNLNVGDTLDFTKVYWGINPYIITSIDSVLLNNSYHKRFNFQTGCLPGSNDSSIIEGIGGTGGLLTYPFCFETGGSLNCFSQNGQQLYPSFAASACTMLSVNEMETQNNFSIYKDDASNMLIIKSESFQKFTYNIFDSRGSLIKSGNSNSMQTEIDVSSFSNGLYLVQVVNAAQNFASKKFLK